VVEAGPGPRTETIPRTEDQGTNRASMDAGRSVAYILTARAPRNTNTPTAPKTARKGFFELGSLPAAGTGKRAGASEAANGGGENDGANRARLALPVAGQDGTHRDPAAL